MTITAYRRPPKVRSVGWMSDPWTVTADGPDPVLYADAEAVEDWFRHRIGRLRRWEDRRVSWISPNGEMVRLLHDTPLDDDETAAGLFAWAEWLRSEGVGVPASAGSTGIKLLKATMHPDHRLIAWTRDVPDFVPLGGRIGGTLPMGPWTGEATLIDLPAAYASTLGDLTWEGSWRRIESASGLPRAEPPTRSPAFIEATVTVPDYLPLGLLPNRPEQAPDVFDRIFAEPDQRTYPTGTTLDGIWTHEEIALAEAAGCDVRVNAVWMMPRNADARPFAPWWAAIQRGRTLPGFGAALAKRTGNATVGALCQRKDGTLYEMAWEGRRLTETPVRTGGAPRHHLLFETVTGRVRARLGRVLYHFGDDALLWHTDGAWVRSEALTFPGPRAAAEGWRRDATATAIDHLSPFSYAYTDGGVTTIYVMPGTTATAAATSFDKDWTALMGDPGRRRRVTPHLEGRS